MAKRSIQGYVELASGLGEMTASRAKAAATELVALSGGEMSPKKLSKQANKLADDLMTAAASNRQNLVSLVRREIETALGRLDVNRVVADLQALSDTVSAVAAQVEDLSAMITGRTREVVDTVSSTVVEAVPEPARVGVRPPRAAFTSGGAAKKTSAKAPVKKVTAKSATAKSTAKAPAKRVSASKSASPASGAPKTSAPAKTTSTKKAAPKRASAAKKSTATKSAATKKTAPAKSATAKKATATKSTATKKSAATKSATAKKSTTSKAAGSSQ